MQENILCVMERTLGEANTGLGYQHFMTFPDMAYIKRIQNYHRDWGNGSGDGNDSSQSAFAEGRIFQANCFADVILSYNNQIDMNHITDYVHTSGWGPTGIAIKGNEVFIIASASGNVEVRDVNDLSKIIRTFSLNTSSYGEHDGLSFGRNGHLYAATANGYIVEMDVNGNYVREDLISSNAYRGAAILNGYLVTCNTDTGYVYVLDLNTRAVLWTYDFSSRLNASGNVIYGSFFLNNNCED